MLALLGWILFALALFLLGLVTWAFVLLAAEHARLEDVRDEIGRQLHDATIDGD